MGTRRSGYQRLRAPSGEALAEPERSADGDGRDLDTVVLDHQAAERAVSFPFRIDTRLKFSPESHLRQWAPVLGTL